MSAWLAQPRAAASGVLERQMRSAEAITVMDTELAQRRSAKGDLFKWVKVR